MTFEMFTAQRRNHYRTYQNEFMKILEMLIKQPNITILWTLEQKSASQIAVSLALRSRVSMRSYPRGKGTLVKLKGIL